MGKLKIPKINTEELEIQTTVMAIREELMSFFKGTCVERVVEGSGVVSQPDLQGYQYLYERRQQQYQQPGVIYVHDVPVLKVKQYPDMLTFLKPRQ